LEDLPRRPHTIHRKVTEEVVGKVCGLRRLYWWSPEKVAVMLKQMGLDMSPMTVYAILRREGLNRPLDKPRRRSYIRWERERPNELWQTVFFNTIPLRVSFHEAQA